MQYSGMVEYLDEVRSARIRLEAALAVSDSEAARAAWRLYHRAQALPNSRAGRDARRLDQAIARSCDEQLIEAKQRYDAALRPLASTDCPKCPPQPG